MPFWCFLISVFSGESRGGSPGSVQGARGTCFLGARYPQGHTKQSLRGYVVLGIQFGAYICHIMHPSPLNLTSYSFLKLNKMCTFILMLDCVRTFPLHSGEACKSAFSPDKSLLNFFSVLTLWVTSGKAQVLLLALHTNYPGGSQGTIWNARE